MANKQGTSQVGNEEKKEVSMEAKEPAKTVRKVVVAGQGTAAPKPKKKKVIIVTAGNAQSSQSAPAAPAKSAQPSGRSTSQGSTFTAKTTAHKIIKPKTAPTPVEVDFHTPDEHKPEEEKKKKTVKKTAAAEEKKAAPAPAAEEESPAKEAAPGKTAKAKETEAKEEAAPSPKKEAPAPKRTVIINDGAIPYIRDPAERLHRNGTSQGTARPASARNGQTGGYNQNRQGSGYGNRTQGQGGYNRNSYGQGGQGRGMGQGTGSYQGRSGGSGYGQGGYGQNRGNAAGGRGPAFGGAGNRRPSSRPAPGGDTFVKDAEKHRDADRRKLGQEKDKRNRKDYLYNEEDSRQKRAGRFVKPEKEEVQVVEEQIKTISVPDKITIRDLAVKMHLHDADIIKKLFLAGQVTTPNTELTYEEVENIAVDYDILCEKEEKVDTIQEMLKDEEDAEGTLVDRAPVVCVMGHVDHGKTTLLDYIKAWSLGITDEDKKERERKMAALSVANKEAGGITQAIGAYQVDVKGRKITFLDTPGHEAFTAMRMRGAKSTDIAILVVAADDGVMPQTVEAINHAKAAGIEIIVAVNKIDKPGANIDQIKQELTKYELVATDWGGNTEFVPVSAKVGTGVTDLLDTVLLTADILELKSNPNRRARGLVLEARLDKGRGPVANVLIQKGTLKVGDFISAGAASGKVRAMIDDHGRNVKEAGPSMPVEVLGLSEAPSAGEIILAHEDDKTAKQFAAAYRDQHKEDLLEETRMHMSLDDLFSQMKEGNLKEFDIIIKADVQGSVEALKTSLLKLSNDEIQVKCIHNGVGAITESDVSLASASNAIIIGFNVKTDNVAKAMADREGVDIHTYNVIYNAIDEVEAAIKGMEAPVYEENIIGHAEIRQLFKASQVGNIAGSSVTDGVIRKGCKCRITRGKDQIFEGDLASLKRFKDDVKEVKEGFECGLVFDGFDAINVGDLVEAFEMVKVTGEKAAEIKAKRKAEALEKAKAEKALKEAEEAE